MLSIMGPLVLGIALGFSGFMPSGFYRLGNLLLIAGLVVLLFSMGFSIGSNEEITGKGFLIVFKALSFAVAGMAGSAVTVRLFLKLTGEK